MSPPGGRIPPGDGDDHDEWMATFRSLPDAEIDDLLAGRAPSSEAAAGLTELVEVLRADARRADAPPMSADLRRQVAGPTPVARPLRKRRRALVGGVLGVVLGTSAVGVAAAQNVLPGPLQDAASSAGGAIGVDLPRADERDADDDQAPAEPAAGNPGAEAPDAQGSGTVDLGVDGTETGRGSGSGSAQPKDDRGTAGQPDTTTSNGPPDTTRGAAPPDPGVPGNDGPAPPATPATPTPPVTGDQDSSDGNGTDDGTDTGQPVPEQGDATSDSGVAGREASR